MNQPNLVSTSVTPDSSPVPVKKPRNMTSLVWGAHIDVDKVAHMKSGDKYVVTPQGWRKIPREEA